MTPPTPYTTPPGLTLGGLPHQSRMPATDVNLHGLAVLIEDVRQPIALKCGRNDASSIRGDAAGPRIPSGLRRHENPAKRNNAPPKDQRLPLP